MLKRFHQNDIFFNTIKTYPECKFLFYNGETFYNEKPQIQGVNTASIYPNIGKVNLYELNVDRSSTQLIYPFVTKDGSLNTFKSVTTDEFNQDFNYGDTITSSYPREAGITSTKYDEDEARLRIDALQNVLNRNVILSPHFQYSSSLGDKSTQELSLIEIPSIFYGSSIKKGSINFKYYNEGVLQSELRDNKRNGELIEFGPSGSIGSGSVAGVALYNEGFIILTGAWAFDSTVEWRQFAEISDVSASFALTFEGINYINTLTMMCHARKGELNFSNNPTFLEYGQTSSIVPISSSQMFREQNNIRIKNIVKSPFSNTTASFSPTTYITSVGIYDKNKNLIAVAKLSSPKRKRIEDTQTYKVVIDF